MTDTSWLGPRIDVRPLFAKQQSAFLTLLRQLDTKDWARPTICPGWTIHDVAAHVLGDHIGRLSIYRDGFQPLHPGDGEQLPAFLHRINDEWVTAARRISPALLIDLLSTVGDQNTELWHSVDLDALGWNVSWATGPDPAPVWLDAARDFTEYWTHQQQIAEASGRAGLTQPEYLAPVLDTFMRALPHTLRDVSAAVGTTLQIAVTGPAGGTWSCTRRSTRWAITRPQPNPDASVVLDTDTAWRLCTRGISPEQATHQAHTEGNQQLTDATLRIVSIIY